MHTESPVIISNLCLSLLQCGSGHKHYKICFEAIPLGAVGQYKDSTASLWSKGDSYFFKLPINIFAFRCFQLLTSRQKKNVLFLRTCYAKLNFGIYSSISLNCSFPKCQVAIYSPAKDIFDVEIDHRQYIQA